MSNETKNSNDRRGPRYAGLREIQKRNTTGLVKMIRNRRKRWWVATIAVSMPSARPIRLISAKPPTPYQKLKAWLGETCRGDWSVTSIPARKACIVAFENSNDYAAAVGFLRPNGPWRLTELPACAAARKTKIGVELYQRLSTPAARRGEVMALAAS